MIKSNSNVIGVFTSVVWLFEIFNKHGFWFFEVFLIKESPISIISKLENYWFQLFQNQRTTSLGYFWNIKELVIFMKEPTKYWWS